MPGRGCRDRIPTDLKVQYLRALIGAGFKHIDAVSFVSPKAVPQMADSEEVLRQLDPPDDVEIIGIVVNEKGAERAIATEAVRTLGFPYSVSETFLKKNQNQTRGGKRRAAGKDCREGARRRARRGGLHLDGVRQPVWRSVEFGGGSGSGWHDRRHGYPLQSRWPIPSGWPRRSRLPSCWAR